jgi:putative sugar O-methyltransferase
MTDRRDGMDTQKNILLSTEKEQEIELKDDFELFDIMLNDSKDQPSLYRPGPYWATKANNAANEIKRCGIGDFRGSKNAIGLSYADNLFVDIRNSYNHGFKRRLARWVANTYPLRIIYDAQIRWTESYANTSIVYAQEILNLKEKTRELLKKYNVPYSLLGKCLTKATIDGQDLSVHYLTLLEQQDNIASRINFNEAKSIFEIGGGFGANIHLLLENYKNIRKVLYLDIPPNLYVGTQYLKAFYGTAVFDYRTLKHLDSIKFSADDNIEIFCIAPWQIGKFESAIDIFMNSHSFVEMSNDIVNNYVDNFKKFPESTNAAVALTAYDDYDLSVTLHPEELPKFFKDRKFDYFEADTLLNSSRKNLFFVSPGKLSL